MQPLSHFIISQHNTISTSDIHTSHINLEDSYILLKQISTNTKHGTPV